MEGFASMDISLASCIVVDTDKDCVAIAVRDGCAASERNIAVTSASHHDLVACSLEIIFKFECGLEIQVSLTNPSPSGPRIASTVSWVDDDGLAFGA